MSTRFFMLTATLILPLSCTQDYSLGEDATVSTPLSTGGIRGRICAPSQNSWIGGADVSVETSEGPATTQTDPDGFFTLADLPNGDYTVNVQKGSFSVSFEATVADGQVTLLAQDQCIHGNNVKMAVFSGEYDSIENVIDRIGFDYDLFYGQEGPDLVNLLTDPARLAQYDILFFNCGINEDWISSSSFPTITQNLKDFVANGGSFYASDWAYYMVEGTFPNIIDFMGDDTSSDLYSGTRVGNSGTYFGTINDPDIASALGSGQATLNYDLDIWAAVQGVANPADAIIEGSFDYGDFSSNTITGPLAVRNSQNGGTIVFMTFHNEAQTTVDMDLILQEIIFDL